MAHPFACFIAKDGEQARDLALEYVTTENGIDTYMDYELVKFNSSGAGFSKSNDVVMNSCVLGIIQRDAVG